MPNRLHPSAAPTHPKTPPSPCSTSLEFGTEGPFCSQRLLSGRGISHSPLMSCKRTTALSKRLMPWLLPTSGQLLGHHLLGHPRNAPACQRTHDKRLRFSSGRTVVRGGPPQRRLSQASPPAARTYPRLGPLRGAALIGSAWWCYGLCRNQSERIPRTRRLSGTTWLPSSASPNLFPIRGLKGCRPPVCL